MTIRLSKSKLKFVFIFFAFLILLVACDATETDEPEDTEISVPREAQVVYVPAGGFYMGSVVEDVLARDDEFPQHQLRMDGFWIWQREVSNYQYAQCVAAGVCSPPVDLGEGPSMHYGERDYQDNPVVGVSWFQAAEFCKWDEARLPTEAEWEKTSRGQFGDLFPWGDHEPSCDLTNMVGCLEEPDTEDIGQFIPGESEYKALDTAGNVWEWVADWYDEHYYPTSPNANPTGPSEGEFRVVRGGSYEDGPVDLRSAARLGLLPRDEFNNVGFRCVPLGLSSPAASHAPFCQDTYIPFCRDPGDDCIPTRTGEDCPPRWHYDTLADRCEPDESGCPQGSYYDTLVRGCVPTTGEDCPEGWQYDTLINRCEPDESGCPPDTNYATLANGCVPTTGEDCPEGWYYDTALERCEPTGDGCPPGTYYDTLEQGCVPEGDGSDCPQGYYYDTAYETCMPTGGPDGAGQPDYELLGFGCPDGSQVTIVLYVGENPTAGYDVSVDNEDFNCVVDSAYPDRLICTGPAQTPGTSANITVCPANGSSQTAAIEQAPGIDAFTPQSIEGVDSPQLISFQPSALSRPELAPAIQGFNGNNGTDGYCPEGYQFNEKTGQCEYPSDGDNCPEGWYFDTQTYECKPEEDGCPPGTLFDTSQERCVPENGDCPQGYYFDTQTETCEPPGNDDGGGACPSGYFYDLNINCCAPITTTTNDCIEGYYYQYETGLCLPTDDYGCGPNLTFNPYEGGCVPNQNDDGDCGPNAYYDTLLQGCVNEDDGCPEGYELGPDGYSCVPSQILSSPSAGITFQTGPGCREPGYVMNELGYCVPDGGNGGEQNDCGPNGYYDTMLERCITPGDGDGDEDCGPGYYYVAAQESCRPTDGPGSPCGLGFAFHTGLNCCVPTPGNDGTFCPDPQFAGQPTPGGNGATSPFMGYSAPSNSNFDYGRGYCDPGDDYECPPGYHSDTQDGSCVPINQGGDCPEGYHSNTPDGSCAPITLAAITTSTLVSLNLSPAQQTQTDCPPGYNYDTYNGGCVRQEFDNYSDDCGEGAYYDYELNFCVPTTCDDCAIGYYFDTQREICVPYDGNGTPGNGDDNHCPLGYYYDTAQETCVPFRNGSQGCWTLTFEVPLCDDETDDKEKRCPQGQELNENDECVPEDRGEEDPDGAACTNPGQYTSQGTCVAAGCNWVNVGQLAPVWVCQP